MQMEPDEIYVILPFTTVTYIRHARIIIVPHVKLLLLFVRMADIVVDTIANA